MKPKRTPWRKLILLPAFMIFLFAGLCVFGEDLTHYQQVYQNPLVVTATVTHHTVDTDTDDGDPYYEVFIAYTAGGTEYTDVLYESSYYPDEISPVGTKISLAVSPEDPSLILSDLYTGGFLFMGVLAVFSLLLGWFMKTLLLCLRTKEVDDMEPESETMKKHGLLTVWSNFLLWAAGFCLCGCGFAYYQYPVPLVEQGLPIYALVSGLVFLLALLFCYPKHGCISREEYTLVQDRLIEKKEHSSLNSTVYYLIFQTENHTWRKGVSRKRYNQAKVGQTIHSVFLPGKKRPLFCYDENWNIM